jgi:hypothetical protein
MRDAACQRDESGLDGSDQGRSSHHLSVESHHAAAAARFGSGQINSSVGDKQLPKVNHINKRSQLNNDSVPSSSPIHTFRTVLYTQNHTAHHDSQVLCRRQLQDVGDLFFYPAMNPARILTKPRVGATAGC